MQSLSARYCHQHIPTQDLSNLFGFPMFPSIKLPRHFWHDNAAAPIPLQDGPSMERVSRVGLLRAGELVQFLFLKPPKIIQNQTVFMIQRMPTYTVSYNGVSWHSTCFTMRTAPAVIEICTLSEEPSPSANGSITPQKQAQVPATAKCSTSGSH